MVNQKIYKKYVWRWQYIFFLSSLYRFVPSSAASNMFIQCVISHLKLYKHACKVFLHKPFQFVQIYFFKAFINWTKSHTHVLQSTSSSTISHEKIPFPNNHQMLLKIQTCDVNIYLCNLYFCLVKKTTTFSLRQIRSTGRYSGEEKKIQFLFL